MTRALKFILERMNNPEYNGRFTKAVLVYKEISKENEATYNRIKAKYPTSKDLSFDIPHNFRDI